jgi:hypothetical protein
MLGNYPFPLSIQPEFSRPETLIRLFAMIEAHRSNKIFDIYGIVITEDNPMQDFS